jgi:hypothetical protein
MARGKVHRPMTKRMAAAVRKAAKLATKARIEAYHANNRGFWARLTDDQRAVWMLERARRTALFRDRGV